MRRAASWVVTVVLAAVCGFQLALIVGAPWGAWTQGGGNEGTLPLGGRLVAAISIVVLVGFWIALVGRCGWGPGRHWSPRLLAIISWAAVAYGVIAVLVNAATPSASERMLWLPVSVVLLAAELVIAWPFRTQQRRTA